MGRYSPRCYISLILALDKELCFNRNIRLEKWEHGDFCQILLILEAQLGPVYLTYMKENFHLTWENFLTPRVFSNMIGSFVE